MKCAGQAIGAFQPASGLDVASRPSTCPRPSLTHVSSRVKGKVVIITGCNSPLGIGRASAHQFARNGAKAIFICDFATTHLATHKRELNSLYPDVEIQTRQMDAGAEEDVKRIVDECLEMYGRLDVFFANAGISITMKRVTESSAEDFMKVMRTNALR